MNRWGQRPFTKSAHQKCDELIRVQVSGKARFQESVKLRALVMCNKNALWLLAHGAAPCGYGDVFVIELVSVVDSTCKSKMNRSQANPVLAIQNCMENFERVEAVLKIKGHSRHSLAKRLGIAQVTFNRYFNKENQDKLAPHLWSILKLFPDVRRDWLFFGEGEMLKSDTPANEAAPVPDLTAELERLRRELEESNRLNRQLVAKLLIDG